MMIGLVVAERVSRNVGSPAVVTSLGCCTIVDWGIMEDHPDRTKSRFAGKLRSGVEAAQTRAAPVAQAVGNRLRQGAVSMGAAGRNAAGASIAAFNAFLATDYAVTLDRVVRDLFAHSKATIYDRAMDWNYIQTHIGGGFHRHFDGGHTFLGAWQAVKEARPTE